MTTLNVKTGHNTSQTVSLVGLYSTGPVLAEAFLKTGFSTTIWHPAEQKGGNLSAKGATFVATPSDAADAGKLVIISLKNSTSLHQILETMHGEFSGKTLLNLVRSTPIENLKTAQMVSKLGFTYINGGSLILPPMIGSIG